MCEQNGIKPLVERSRSGRGAHVWIFFKKPISASLARNFGFLLLDKGAATVNMKSFHYYDRMYPSQDVASSIGNLIALPLQGQAVKNGNSAFVDENWNAYPNQWEVLLHGTEKLGALDIEAYMEKWQQELAEARGRLASPDSSNRPKPWKKKCEFLKADVVGKLHLVLSDGLYADTLKYNAKIIKIKSEAWQPLLILNSIRMPEWDILIITILALSILEKMLMGIFRCQEDLEKVFSMNVVKQELQLMCRIKEKKGRPIRVSFKGDLRTQQDLAAQRLSQHSEGVLQAATAFGKTVVSSYLISERKVSTLILLHSKDLLSQWVEELQRFYV